MQTTLPCNSWKSLAAAMGAALLFAGSGPVWAAPERSEASADGPAQIAYSPPDGKGHVIVMLSGHNGPSRYEAVAETWSKLGYYVVLLDGKDILNADRKGGERLRQAITRAQAASAALPGKVAVIGYSQGGGGALAYASRMAELVTAVVAYYPQTSYMTRNEDGISKFIDGIKVPVLLMAGEADTYKNCCLIATARTIAAAAKEASAPLEFVEYAKAAHDFDHAELAGVANHEGAAYNPDAAKDAMGRAQAALARQFAP